MGQTLQFGPAGVDAVVAAVAALSCRECGAKYKGSNAVGAPARAPLREFVERSS
jgi:hypothetical protein